MSSLFRASIQLPVGRLAAGLLLCCACLFGGVSSFAGETAKPNVILILLDDLGWGDVGYQGNSFIETPVIDQLAREGVVFSNAYSNSPNCAPSRAALMTGLYAPRTGVYTMVSGDLGDTRLRSHLTPENRMHLEPDFYTLAEMFRDAGYTTAHIGKWNLGSGEVRGPEGQGFDFNVGGFRGGHPHNGYFAPYDLPGLENAPEGEYLTNRLNDEATAFIKRSGEQPFFIYLSHFAPHFPFQAEQHLVEKYREKAKTHSDVSGMPEQAEYAAMVQSVDDGLGRILQTLHETGAGNNTLIIFTSDNGGMRGYSWFGPYRGEKSLVYEGGIRVPMFWWWQGHIIPSVSEYPVMGIDIFSTLNRLLGGSAGRLDGADLSSVLGLGAAPAAPGAASKVQAVEQREALFWYFPAYVAGENPDASDRLFQQRPVAVIQQSGWKLLHYLDSGRIELYHLEEDPGETSNRAKYEPARSREMTAALTAWLVAVGVDEPLQANPEFDAEYASRYHHDWFDRWIAWFRQWLD